jgi:hypothetical protein
MGIRILILFFSDSTLLGVRTMDAIKKSSTERFQFWDRMVLACYCSQSSFIHE